MTDSTCPACNQTIPALPPDPTADQLIDYIHNLRRYTRELLTRVETAERTARLRAAGVVHVHELHSSVETAERTARRKTAGVETAERIARTRTPDFEFDLTRHIRDLQAELAEPRPRLTPIYGTPLYGYIKPKAVRRG
jgi:hypothetical protein